MAEFERRIIESISNEELIKITIPEYVTRDEKANQTLFLKNEFNITQREADQNMSVSRERAVELINKKLGLGKWAVGGTKAIWAYDKDNYDKEREDRVKAGIFDFPGTSDGEIPLPEGKNYDEDGFPIYGDMNFEADGYDQNQHGDDDYE